jgi:hypothetical protein
VILIRRILVAVIAMSVAVPQATTEAIASPSPAEIAMVDQADMPCCPTQDDFNAIACVFKCAAFAAAVLPAMTIAPLYSPNRFPRTLVDDTLHGLPRAPPTHPPPT